jgi:putative ABC transport system permease protein
VNLLSLLNALPGAVAQGLIWGIMAIGVFITYKVLDLADLTVDGTMATGGAVCVMLMLNGWNVWLALLCAMAAGMLAGLVTGLFHTGMGIPAILAGILTQLSLYSLNLAVMDFKANQGINVTKYQLIVSQRNVRTVDLSNPIFITLLILVLLIGILYWFFGTETGSALRATGANDAMSRAQGINTKRTKILGLIISNGIVALASALLAHYQGFVDVNMGRGAIVIGLAAVIISEVLFSKLFRNFALKLLGVSIGAVLYFIVIQVVLWLGLNTNLLKLLSALIVAAFLGLPYWRAGLAAKHHRKGGHGHA